MPGRNPVALSLAASAAAMGSVAWAVRRRQRGAGSLAGQRVWIVGASSGIGAALARELLRRGAKVAISARREALLHKVADRQMLVVPLDVTDDAATDAAAAQVRRELGGLDLVIHSAGVSQPMDVQRWDRTRFDATFALNIGGLNSLLGAVLPMLLEQQHGRLVGIASLAGLRGVPGAQAYTASKAAQINLLEGLRAALLPYGVGVTTVCPGFVRSEMTDGNHFPMPLLMEAERAATLICDGLQRGQAHITLPLLAGMVMRAAQVIPTRAWSWALAAAGFEAVAHNRQEVGASPPTPFLQAGTAVTTPAPAAPNRQARIIDLRAAGPLSALPQQQNVTTTPDLAEYVPLDYPPENGVQPWPARTPPQ